MAGRTGPVKTSAAVCRFGGGTVPPPCRRQGSQPAALAVATSSCGMAVAQPVMEAGHDGKLVAGEGSPRGGTPPYPPGDALAARNHDAGQSRRRSVVLAA